jgi:hypothetical protein
MQSALGTGLTYMPMFLEYWTTDAINPALDSVIQNATASMQGNTTGTGTQVYAAPHGGYAAWSLDNSLAGIKFDPGIVGIDLYVPWNMVQTGPTSDNWYQLDKRIQEASAAGLAVTLVLADGPTHAPSFVINNPAVQTISLLDTSPSHTTYGQVLTGPVFWDQTYLADRIAFIQTVGARYADNPSVVAVTSAAVNWYTDGWNLPTHVGPVTIGSTTYDLNQPSQWLAAGYTDAKMQSAIQQIMDATATAFPHQTLRLGVGLTSAALDGTASGLAAAALDYAYSHYAGRIVSQLDCLSSVSPAATAPNLGQGRNSLNYLYYLLEQHGGQVGFRMLASATDGPTNGYLANGGISAPPATVLQNAINAGLTYQPTFLEYWTDDATNATLDSVIQQATQTLEANP